MSHSGNGQGPDYKDQVREAQGAHDRNIASGEKSDPGRAVGPGGEAANHGAPVLAEAVPVSTISGVTPSNTSGTSGEYVVKISKRTVLWSVGLVLALAGAAVGGYCASGKCSGSSGGPITSGNDSALNGSPSLRPVVAPLPTTPATGPQAEEPPMAVSCNENSDCPLNICARASLASQEKVCCPTGDRDYLVSPISDYVCTGQVVGAACTADSICSSNACLQGVCLATPQDGGAVCDSNNDCAGTCVQGTCTEDFFVEVGGVCDEDSDCPNGECAHGTLATGMICCPTGASIYLFSPISKNVCTGQLVGADCGNADGLCQSGVCFEGLCQEGARANGQSCESNADCQGACIGGVCDDAFQPTGAMCDDDDDCANGECAYATAATSEQICCPSGQSVYLSSPISRSICTQQAAGAACGTTNRVCESGVCFQGICQADKFPTGEPCETNVHCEGTCVQGICVNGFLQSNETCDDDDDCAVSDCAAQTISTGKVCCPTGDSLYLSSPISEYVCTGQSTGAACGTSDRLCSSEICVSGTCRDSQLATGEVCDSNTDCSDTCVRGVCATTGQGDLCDDDGDCPLNECAARTATSTDQICCTSGASVYLSSPIATTVCTNQDVGAICGSSDRVCASGSCVEGKCA